LFSVSPVAALIPLRTCQFVTSANVCPYRMTNAVAVPSSKALKKSRLSWSYSSADYPAGNPM
jgi:hypothetical protein